MHSRTPTPAEWTPAAAMIPPTSLSGEKPVVFRAVRMVTGTAACAGGQLGAMLDRDKPTSDVWAEAGLPFIRQPGSIPLALMVIQAAPRKWL